MLRGSWQRVAASILVAATAFTIILALLLRYPIMYGIDGPYYIVQVRTLLSKGVLKYPDPPLSFYMLAPFYASFSDPNLGLKVGTAFYVALAALILFWVIAGRADVWSGAAASLIFTVSPYTLRLAMDFIKNTIGILFITTFLAASYSVKGGRKAVILGSLSAAAAAATHVLDFGVLAALACLILLYWPLWKNKRRETFYASAAALVTSLLILSLALTVVPETLGYDVEKLIAFLKNPTGGGGKEFRMRLEFIPAAIISTIGLLYSLWLRREADFAPIFFAASITLLGVNFPLLSSSWLFRFQLMSGVMLPLILFSAVFEAYEGHGKFVVFTLLLGLAAFFTVPMIPFMKPSIPVQGYMELGEAADRVPPGATLVVPNTALRYWVEAVLGEKYRILPALPRPPPSQTYVIISTARKSPPNFSNPIFVGEFIKIYRVNA